MFQGSETGKLSLLCVGESNKVLAYIVATHWARPRLVQPRLYTLAVEGVRTWQPQSVLSCQTLHTYRASFGRHCRSPRGLGYLVHVHAGEEQRLGLVVDNVGPDGESHVEAVAHGDTPELQHVAPEKVHVDGSEVMGARKDPICRRAEVERRLHEHPVDRVAARGVAPEEGVQVVELEALVEPPWSILVHVLPEHGPPAVRIL